MKKNQNNSFSSLLSPFTDSELAFLYDFEKSVNLFEKQEIKIDISNFIISSDGKCKISMKIPDERSIRLAINSAKKKELMSKAIIIARYSWLKRNKLPLPTDMELANLCLQIKEGKLIRAYYANTLTHLPKKINYHFQFIN